MKFRRFGALLWIGMAGSTWGQTSVTWNGGSGNWNDPVKWSTGAFPNSATADVSVDGAPGTASQIGFGSPNVGVTITVGRLQIDAGDSVVFPTNKNLILASGGFTGAGQLTNHGSLQMVGIFNWGNGAGTPSALAGTGSYLLGNATTPLFLDSVPGGSALANHATLGGYFNFGTVNSTNPLVRNFGIIQADIPGTASIFAISSSSTNGGTLKAINGATLSFSQGNWDNTGGTITADGTGSVVQQRSGTISGGTINASNGGQVWLTDSPRWRNVTFSGEGFLRWPLSGGAPGKLEMFGTIANTGTLTVGPSSFLLVGRDGTTPETVTLSGGGQILLRGTIPHDNREGNVNSNSFENTFYNQNNTISGYGTIGDAGGGAQRIHVRNGGTIQADQSGKTLGVYVLNLANETGGVIRAKDGGIIQLLATAGITNTGGTIEALSGGIVRASGLTRINGGLVRNSGGDFPLHNFVLANPGGGMAVQGDFTIGNGQRLRLVNEISNSGDLRIAGDGSTGLVDIGETANRSATLTGGGTIHLGNTVTGSAASELRENAEISGTLTLTNLDNRIRGFGTIGSSGRQLTLVNRGGINADVAAKTLGLALGSFDNSGGGLLQAKNGGSLAIAVSNGLNNAGGTIETLSGSAASLTNTRISGGLLRNSGSTFTLAGSTFDSRTDAVATSGEFTVPNGSSLRLVGNPGSTGTIRWNSTGGETRLLVGETGTPDVTIPAGGEFIFNGNTIVDGGVSTATLTNNATIRGMGTFGYFGVPAVVNRNRIDADVSGEFLNFRLTSATNSGTIRALSGGALRFEVGTLDNSGGTIRAESGSQLLFSGYPRTLNGGSVINAAGSTMIFTDGITVTGGVQFRNLGTAEMRRGYSEIFNGAANGGGTFINDGLLRVTGGEYQFRAPITQRGELRSENGALRFYNGGTFQSGTLVTNASCATLFTGDAGTVYHVQGAGNSFGGAGFTRLEPGVELRFADASATLTATDFRTSQDPVISGPGTLEVSTKLMI